MKVNFKRLNDAAVLPTRANPGDAGLDLVATSKEVVTDGEKGFYYIEYGTGLAVEIPKGYVGLIFPRSSISKTALILSNSVGVIDSGYRGEIKFRFKADGVVVWEAESKESIAQYKIGDRVGQMIILPYPEILPQLVEELGETERGTGGFGSSGS